VKLINETGPLLKEKILMLVKRLKKDRLGHARNKDLKGEQD
jgi:hypothetical protein